MENLNRFRDTKRKLGLSNDSIEFVHLVLLLVLCNIRRVKITHIYWLFIVFNTSLPIEVLEKSYEIQKNSSVLPNNSHNLVVFPQRVQTS